MSPFAHPEEWPEDDLIGVTAGIEPLLTLDAYAHGVFPMPLRRGVMGWWSPVHRGVLPLDGLRVSRSLRKTAKRYRITVDHDFDGVLDRCADPRREGAWIDKDIRRIYRRLFREGYAHSVEARDGEGRLVGGLYGVGLGGLFAGESMFHDPERGRDASKAALIALVDRLSADGVSDRLLDVQWRTDHLAGLGVVEIERAEYLRRLRGALTLPGPSWT